MSTDRKQMNKFLVGTFNEILRTEELALAKAYPDLSVKEIHVIDAINTTHNSNSNTVVAVANELRITAGSLTTAVKVLENKGYLKREKDELDKRIVRLSLSKSGQNVCKFHSEFHDLMVDEIINTISDDEARILAKGLDKISRFFKRKYEEHK